MKVHLARQIGETHALSLVHDLWLISGSGAGSLAYLWLWCRISCAVTSGSQTATPVERSPGAPQDTVEGSGKAGLPDRESPYGAPQVAVGDSGVAPPDAAAASHSLTQASTS